MDANLFTEGAIYYYENKSFSKKDYDNKDINHDFIVSRPVYVLGQRKDQIDTYTVNVLLITSSPNRIGIPINITGFREGEILPFSIYSLHTEYLTRYLGSVSDEMKREVKQAVGYHLGYLDEVPKYLKDYREFIDIKKRFVESLSTQEREIYLFLEKSCSFQSLNYLPYNEFLTRYESKIQKKNRYDRLCDISRAINKMKKIFPNISFDKHEGETVIKGISFEDRIHKLETENRTYIAVKGIPTEKAEIQEDFSTLNKTQLLNLLHTKNRRIYEGLSIVDEFKNYKKNPEDFTFDVSSPFAARIIKQLMTNDVIERIERIKEKMKTVQNPHQLSHSDQLIIYHMNDKDIADCVPEKYIKKGIVSFKKAIRQRIRYLLR